MFLIELRSGKHTGRKQIEWQKKVNTKEKLLLVSGFVFSELSRCYPVHIRLKHWCASRSNAKNLIQCNWRNLHWRIWKLDYYNRWIISGLANATLLPNTFLCWIGYCGFLLHGLTAIVKFKGCSSFILVGNYQQQDRVKYNSAVKGLTFVAVGHMCCC